jgi:ubiquinone/menaquinone biosynthesis C-methylase UbiE
MDYEQREGIRAGVHGMWAAVAPGWAENADLLDELHAPTTDLLLDRAELSPGDRVLELACGPGGLGLEAATRVSPGGEAVLSDVAEPMTEIAARRADRRGLDNVSTRVLDIEQIDEPDASYDAVICRMGLMFAIDPGRAADEIARVLRPGGRLACSTWAARERNPWLGIILDSVSKELGAPVPPPGIPGPFALSDAGRLQSLLAGAGLVEVSVSEAEEVQGDSSLEEWWERRVALAGPLQKMLENLAPEVVEAIRERAFAAAADHAAPDGGLEFTAISNLASGRKGL